MSIYEQGTFISETIINHNLSKKINLADSTGGTYMDMYMI